MEVGGQEGGLPGGSQGARPSNKRLQQTQAQVDEVVGIMKVSHSWHFQGDMNCFHQQFFLLNSRKYHMII